MKRVLDMRGGEGSSRQEVNRSELLFIHHLLQRTHASSKPLLRWPLSCSSGRAKTLLECITEGETIRRAHYPHGRSSLGKRWWACRTRPQDATSQVLRLSTDGSVKRSERWSDRASQRSTRKKKGSHLVIFNSLSLGPGKATRKSCMLDSSGMCTSKSLIILPRRRGCGRGASKPENSKVRTHIRRRVC